MFQGTDSTSSDKENSSREHLMLRTLVPLAPAQIEIRLTRRKDLSKLPKHGPFTLIVTTSMGCDNERAVFMVARALSGLKGMCSLKAQKDLR